MGPSTGLCAGCLLTWQFVVAGLAVGVLVGMTGMGGGSLMTPILVFILGFNPATAIGTDILHGAIFKTVGGLRHQQLGTTQAKLSDWMFLGSAPASLSASPPARASTCTQSRGS